MSNKKNAIFMLIFNKLHYLVGGFISGYIHKKFIKKLGLEIELVVMVDKKINEYREELLKVFDRVELVELLEIRLNKEYYYANKYSSWMKNSITKWEILKYEEYEKILFIDVDILAVEENFYKIFEIRTPAVERGYKVSDRKIELEEISDRKEFREEEYYKASKHLKKSLDGGLVLIKPERRLYEEYIKFIKICEGREGYISLSSSGADETSLLLFLVYYMKKDIYTISKENSVILWEEKELKKINGINYLCLIKPWVKMPIISWPEENIYHRIAKRCLKKSKILRNIYLYNLLGEIVNYNKYIKENLKKRNSPYNLEIIDNEKLRRVSVPLLKEIEKKFKEFKEGKEENYEYYSNLTMNDYKIFEGDFKRAKEINMLMDKKSLIDMRRLGINKLIKD